MSSLLGGIFQEASLNRTDEKKIKEGKKKVPRISAKIP
jgi:hypothetical protein